MMKKKILIIESNATDRMLLNEILASSGMNYHIATNGQEGLDYYTNNQVALVLTDTSSLSDMTDTAIIQALKKIKPVPVIACSSRCFPHEVARVKNAGCDEFIYKPFEIEMLYSVLQKYLT